MLRPSKFPAPFTLNKEEDYGDVISGTYYYQLDTDDEWEYSYIVSGLTDISMVWTAKEDMGEIKVYTRCEDIPSDILTGTRTHSNLDTFSIFIIKPFKSVSCT